MIDQPQTVPHADGHLRISHRIAVSFAFAAVGSATVARQTLWNNVSARADAVPGASPRVNCRATPSSATPAAGAASPEPTTTIRMPDQLRFEPPEITVSVGQLVTWINASQIPHTATGDPSQNPLNESRPDLVVLPDGAEPWGLELLNQGSEFTHTFNDPGRYEYICIPHVLSDMIGVVVVEC